MKNKNRIYCAAFFAIVLFFLGLRFFPIIDANIHQDDCSFGVVTNTQYREKLVLANRTHASSDAYDTASSSKNRLQIIDDDIRRRLDGLLTDEMAYAEKIAVVHATMRSMGAVYRSTEAKPRKGRGKWAYESLNRPLGLVRSNYYLPDDHISPGWLLGKWWVSVSALYFVEGNSKFGIGPNSFQFTVFLPSLIDGRPLPRSPAGENCPIIPKQLAAN